MAGDGDRGTGEPSLVRPYTLTAGRTDAQVELALEAAVVGHGDAAEPQRAASDETVRVDLAYTRGAYEQAEGRGEAELRENVTINRVFLGVAYEF